ncbi:MAG TPA: hypothetical protein VJ949_09255 [Cryomorphaceae bacterium]|nr:hypothetical protein [Cryomorphaceae bacterium]
MKYLFEIMLVLSLLLFGVSIYYLIQIEEFSWAENKVDIISAFSAGLIAFNFGYMLRKKRKEQVENQSEER